MCQKGLGALGSIIDLFAAEAMSGKAWFLYYYFFKLSQLRHIPFPSHHNFNQDQLHLHLTPASS